MKYLPQFGVRPFVFTTGTRPIWPTREVPDGLLLPASHVFRADWYRLTQSNWARIRHKVLDALPLGWSLARWIYRHKVLQAVKEPLRDVVKTTQPDAVLATSPPPEALLIGEFLHDRFALPLLCDLRDPWSYFAATTYRHALDFLVESLIEARILRKAVLVLANTPTARRLLCAQSRLPPEKVVVLPNGYDEAVFREAERLPPILPPEKFHIVHAGFLPGKSEPGLLCRIFRPLGFFYHPTEINWTHRSPRYLLAALEKLLQEHPTIRETLRLVFVGPPMQAKDTAWLRRFPFPECIQIMHTVPEVQAARIMLDASLLVLLSFSQTYRRKEFSPVIPGKIYSYLRSGRPILAPVSGTDIRELIARFQAGVSTDPEDVDGMAEVIRTYWERWVCGDRAPRPPSPALGEYSREATAAKLTGLLRQYLEGRGRLKLDRESTYPAPPRSVRPPILVTDEFGHVMSTSQRPTARTI